MANTNEANLRNRKDTTVTHPYHVKITGEAVLEVEIGDQPITISLTSAGGKRVTLVYAGQGGGGRAFAKVDNGMTMPAIPASQKTISEGIDLFKVAETDGGANPTTFEYVDPGGSRMP